MQKPLTISRVNLLFLVSLMLVLMGSMALPNMPSYWALVMRELLFILLPALLLVRLSGLPIKETLRLRWPGWKIAALSGLLGVGVWLVDVWLSVALADLLGYTVPMPPDLYPATPAQAVLAFCGLAVAAPLCEEVFFRGVLQRGYEQRGPRFAIIVGGVLFIVFHQSLAQGLALIPIAFLLGYVAWRSDSLVSSIFVHFGNNVLASLVITFVTPNPELDPGIGTIPSALIGVVLVVVGLWLFHRVTTSPEPLPEVERQRGFVPWLRRAWPLLFAIPLYLLLIGMEVVLGRFPEAMSTGQSLELQAAPWDGPVSWAYEVQNVLDEPVGEVNCSLVSGGAEYTLKCHHRQQAYEADTGHGVYYGGDVDKKFTARWSRDDLRLLAFDLAEQVNDSSREISVTPEGDSVLLVLSADGGSPEEVSLPVEMPVSLFLPEPEQDPILLEIDEWPWRFSALSFSVFQSTRTPVVYPYTWRESTQDQSSLVEPVSVIIYGAEPVYTPAGNFVAWRIEVGDSMVAWYDVNPPYTLVSWTDSVDTWVLVAVD